MASSGWWLARMPMLPTAVRVDSISTSSLKASPSGVRTSTVNGVRGIGLALGALDDLVDRALHEERRLRQVVVLAVEHLAERAYGLADRHVLARRAGELLGHVERLREEALDLARPLHELAVLVRELVDAEDRDDVLQLAVALQHALDLVGDREVLLAEDLRLEDRGGRVERVDRGIDALLRDRARQRRRRVEVGEHGSRRRVR